MITLSNLLKRVKGDFEIYDMNNNYICNRDEYTRDIKREYGKHFVLILESDIERIRIVIA